MRNFHLGLVLLLGLSSGGLLACGQCDALCLTTVNLTVRDPSGAPVTSFSGVVSLEDDSLAVACPDSQTRGVSCERYANLRILTLPFRGSPVGLEVELTSTSTPTLAFSGPVRLDVREGEICGRTCFTGTATVTLR